MWPSIQYLICGFSEQPGLLPELQQRRTITWFHLEYDPQLRSERALFLQVALESMRRKQQCLKKLHIGAAYEICKGCPRWSRDRNKRQRPELHKFEPNYRQKTSFQPEGLSTNKVLVMNHNVFAGIQFEVISICCKVLKILSYFMIQNVCASQLYRMKAIALTGFTYEQNKNR